MTIIITGASKGIGRAIAEKFAANGYSLFLCARNKENLVSVKEELLRKYPFIHVHTKTCDVAVKEDLKIFAEWILATASSIDVLINNAGRFVDGGAYDGEGIVLEEMMQSNVYSAYYLSRFLLPKMIGQKKGHVFNICSIASLGAYPSGGAYGITKYALAGFSANLREEMKPHNIKVTSVFPGAVYTPSWDGSGIAPDRIMKAEDIAEMIYTSAHLSAQACVEDIVIRPQLGDL
ncbi:MAG: SDR family oxidoreductase [Flavitalea sp.]